MANLVECRDLRLGYGLSAMPPCPDFTVGAGDYLSIVGPNGTGKTTLLECVAKSFRAVTTVAAVFSVVCSLAGILVAVVAGTPVGSTIVGVDIAGFILLSAIGRFLP